jgi:5'-deoxynucleotidase YfbR-like HD superfamily hydrolase
VPEQGLEGIARFLYEMGALKRLPRSGWLIAGVAAPESIAEHSFRTAILGWLLAHMEGQTPPGRRCCACSTTPRRRASATCPPSARDT